MGISKFAPTPRQWMLFFASQWMSTLVRYSFFFVRAFCSDISCYAVNILEELLLFIVFSMLFVGFPESRSVYASLPMNLSMQIFHFGKVNFFLTCGR